MSLALAGRFFTTEPLGKPVGADCFKVFFNLFIIFLLLYVFIFALRHMRSWLPNQGSNPHLLHWKMKSWPLNCQGSSWIHISNIFIHLISFPFLRTSKILMLQGEIPPGVEFWSLFAVTSSWAIHKFQFPVKYLFAAAQGCWRLKCAEHCDDLDICDSTGNIVMVRDRVYIMVVKVKVTQSCQTLCNPHGLYSP